MTTEEGRRPLIIGESPSAAGNRFKNFPLSGNPARFLCDVAQLEVDEDDRKRGVFYWALTEHFDTANAVESFPGTTWPAEKASERVTELVKDYEVVVLMGRRAQQAYPYPPINKMPFFEWHKDIYSMVGPERKTRLLVAIPHSSGRNHVYNDPMMRKEAGRVLREAIEMARATK